MKYTSSVLRPCANATAAITMAAAKIITRAPARISPPRLRLYFHQLEAEAVEIFDHHRACVRQLIGTLKDGHAGRLQVGDHRVEIWIGQTDVIDHLTLRFRQR